MIEMSSSVLGLGAAGLGASAMRTPGVKQKSASKVNPSAQDYFNSYLSLMFGVGQPKSDKRQMQAFFGGPLKSATGNFYYNEAPKKVPEGAFVVRGQDISVQQSSVNAGSSTKTIPTYQVVRTQPAEKKPEPAAPEPQLRMDLSQGGKVDVLNRKDIKHAVAQGASMKEVRQAARTQDLRVSAKAKSMLQKSKQQGK